MSRKIGTTVLETLVITLYYNNEKKKKKMEKKNKTHYAIISFLPDAYIILATSSCWVLT